MKFFNFNQTESDHCVFYGKVNGVNVFLALCRRLLVSSLEKTIIKVLKLLQERFQITVGDAKQFVGMEIERNRQNRTIKIGQKIYIQKLLERFRLEDANSVSVPAESGMHLTKIKCPKSENKTKQMENIPYREAIGSLLFAARVSRPDIEYVVNQASQFLNDYSDEHWKAVKRIFRYLKGTIDYGIVYGCNKINCDLVRYTNADYAGCIDTQKSTSGFIFLLNGGAITWSSQKQRVIARSTTEAEYITLATGTKDAI